MHWLLDHTEVSCFYSNESLYNICKQSLQMEKPDYLNMNRIIAKSVSILTGETLRWDNESDVDIKTYQTDLVPFARLHFMTMSLSPIISLKNKNKYVNKLIPITYDCLNPNNFLLKYNNFDTENDKYMAMQLHFRLGWDYGEYHFANHLVQSLKSNKKCKLCSLNLLNQ